MSNLVVYKASAGSGKTFTLAVEYIKLLLADPTAYRHILAVTFTHKATSEMKERILGQLYALSRALPGSEAYLNVLMADTGLSEQKIRERTAEALIRIVHDYGRFRVETIDSFFQSVMRNLARELGLAPNLNIELDQAKVLREAVENLLRDAASDAELMMWIYDYMQERMDQDRSWNVIRNINDFGRQMFNERFLLHKESVHRRLEEKGYIRDFRKRLLDCRTEIEAKLSDCADRFDGILQSASLTAEDFKGKSRFPLFAYFKKIREGKELTDKDILSAGVQKLLNGEDEWALAKSPRSAEVRSIGHDRLLPLLEETEKVRKESLPMLYSLRLASTHIYNIGLLDRLRDEMHRENERQGRFLLSDTNDLLRTLVGDDDTSFVYEKTGTVIRNIMIDEFQDTSSLQWQNFKLLLMEGLAQNEDSLIVGDVKQSIYRWRGGEWDILNRLSGQFGPYKIEERRLQTNRRSHVNIIRFNNLLFPRAMEVLCNRYTEETGQDSASMARAYTDVEQQWPDKPAQGLAEIRVLPFKKEGEYVQETLRQLLETIRGLLASGISQKDIAVLFRFKKHIPIFAEYFGVHAPELLLISNETYRLDASLAVSILIHALRCLADESNTMDAAAVARLWNEAFPGQTDYACGSFAPLSEESLIQHIYRYFPSGWTEQYPTLSTLPLQELLERLCELFQLHRIPGQDAYLFFFFDKVQEYLQSSNANLPDFLSFWEDTLSAATIPADSADGIRILTIHASKGLEFHTVLMPFCDWELERDQGLVWCRTPEVSPLDGLPILPVSYGKLMKDSFFHGDYEKEKLQQWVDNLNLLYVACTRPKVHLFVWSQGKPNTVGSLMEQALMAPFPDETPTEGWQEVSLETIPGNEDSPLGEVESNQNEKPDSMCVFRLGTEVSEISEQKAEKKNAPANIFLPVRKELEVSMCSSRSRMEFRQSNRSAAFIAAEGMEEDASGSYLDQGLVMHSLFASIRTMEDLEPALEQMKFEGILSDEEMTEARRISMQAFSNPQVAQWYDGTCRLYNECTILYRSDAEEPTIERRPDRVMMRNGCVTVVDFKFGTPRDRYQNQVREYMRLLRQMGNKYVEGYLWYVYQNEIVPVVLPEA